MKLKADVRKDIYELIIKTIRNKLEKYNPETDHKPFHHRLLGKDRYAMFSFIHSMNTTFGMSLFEPIGVLLAKSSGFEAIRQYKLEGEISPEVESKISQIMNQLRSGEKDAGLDWERETLVAEMKVQYNIDKHPDSTVDLYVKKQDGNEHYFDITSVKPNMKEFVALKRKLLNWIALRLSHDDKIKPSKIHAQLAIPYNPYHPKPYDRWTLKGLYDLKKEIFIGREFWNFLGDGDIFDDLLNAFEEAGKYLSEELDEYFKQFS
jgi:hypothetical protein